MAVTSRDVRLETLNVQGVGRGAAPPPRLARQATGLVDQSLENDWRVRLSVPSTIQGSAALEPLSRTNNHMIFPFTPTVIISQRANYSDISPTHSNYVFNAYQNSQVDDIVITGDFIVENEEDAEYWLSAVHYLRTMTKMFYGQSAQTGNPPMVCRLKGYGKYVLNDIPVVIKSFQVDLQSDVDYILCSFLNQGNNYVPVRSTIAVTVSPNYARRTVSRFSLNDFANGSYVSSGNEGYI